VALTSQQLVTLATQIGKGPSFLSQTGQFLNLILSDLAQLNDMELSRGLFQINTSAPSGISPVTGQNYYNLASDHLHILQDGAFYLVNGVPYTLIQQPLEQFDQLVTTQGFTLQMVYYAVDDSFSPPQIYFWPPPNGSYIVNIRYIRLRLDIVTPETSSVVPWFPEQNILLKRLAGFVCHLTNDDRATKFEKDAEDMLRLWLPMQRDAESYIRTVELDRRVFSKPYSQLQNTKTVGF
jgi:hypothetical protein